MKFEYDLYALSFGRAYLVINGWWQLLILPHVLHEVIYIHKTSGYILLTLTNYRKYYLHDLLNAEWYGR